MAVSAGDIKKLSGEFSSLENSQINIFLGMAKRCINASVWGDKADDGIKLLTAHFVSMANRGGASGSITKEKVGDLEISYGSGGGSESDLATTSWGKLFLAMRRTLVITPMVVSCPK